MRNLIMGGVAAAALLAACPTTADAAGASAEVKTLFRQCDGYEVPSEKADGMLSSTFLWTTLPTDNLAAKTQIGAGGWAVESCDKALADPHLLAAYWRRKVNLLTARARHHLEAGDSKAALADLDLAEAAVADPNDPFYARSQAIGIGFLRAYALGQSGDRAGSEATAQKYLALRPYSRQGGFAALAIVSANSDSKLLEPLTLTVAQLQPDIIDDLYLSWAGKGRWADVIPLYGQLATPKVRRRVGYGGWLQEYEVVELVGSNMFWIDRTGIYAYALATQGRDAEARSALAAARTRLDAALVPDPPLKPENNPSQKKIDDAAAKLKLQQALAQRGNLQLERWTNLIDLRIKINEGAAADVAATLARQPPPRNVFGQELKSALAARLKADPKTSPDLLKSLEAPAAPAPPVVAPAPRPPQASTATPRRDSLFTLLKLLPTPETSERVPRYRKAGAGIFVSEAGFSVSRASDEFTGAYGSDVTVVEFRSLDTNAQMAEEMALLRAADLALQAGKTGLVVLARRDVQHTINSTYYGMVMSSTPDGFSTELTVLFVDKASLPERLKGAEWRVIDARAVYDALSPVYLQPEPAKKSKK